MPLSTCWQPRLHLPFYTCCLEWGSWLWSVFLSAWHKFGINFDLVNTSLITPQCKVWPKRFLRPSHIQLLISCGQRHVCACVITALSLYRTLRNLSSNCFPFPYKFKLNFDFYFKARTQHPAKGSHAFAYACSTVILLDDRIASNIFKFSCSLILSIRHTTLS